MDLSKGGGAPAPQVFKGYSAVATVYADRVEIKRNRMAKLAGHKDSTTRFTDIVKPHGKPPTRLVNGYVHLAAAEDPPQLKFATMEISKTFMGNERSILFTWNQRDTQDKYLAAVLAGWRRTYSGHDLA